MIAPDEADEPALDLDPVRTEYACFVSRIGGLQRNRGALATESLQGRFLVVDQRDDDIPGLAVLPFRMITVSPSRMPASIIESPLISRA